ncbi:MAG TPA: efflux RND transporter permease subunit, partial [Kineobactrum sp.]
ASARLSFNANAEGDSRDDHPLQAKITDKIGWLIATPRRRVSCIVVTVVVSGAIAALLTPPAEYLPEGEEPKTFAFMSAPPGYNLETMTEIGMELQDYFLQFVGDDPARFSRGETDVPAMSYLNMGIGPQSLRIISESTDPSQIDELMAALVRQYETYPGMRAFAARGSIISSNDGGTRSVNLDVSGADLGALFTVARAAYNRAEEVFENPSIQTRPSSLSLGQPLLQVRPRWERAAELGLTTEDIGFTVAALTDGAFVNEFFLADDKIDIYLYNQQGPGASLDTLQNISIYVPGNTTLPLSDVAEVIETVDTSSIRRLDGRRSVTLNIIPPRSVALETGVGIVREDVVRYLQESGAVPSGVTLSISGAADQLDSTRAALSSNYLVALVIIYLLMVAIFAHWGYPLLIMATIPLGIAGGIAGLALMNLIGAVAGTLGLGGFSQPFDMISMLGFLILMGTVVNNPILIVHRAISNLKEEGLVPVEAVREAVGSRLRPIAISTITTIVGLAPLVFLPGAGSELYRGVGVIVMAGIVGATIVTLTMLPSLTVMVLEWSERGNRQKNRTGKQHG